MVQETQPAQLTFSEQEWAQTPPAVQEFVLALVVRVQELETELSVLRERVKRNSHNSSQPPSSDGPDAPPKPRQHAKSNRQRGGQPGHTGTQRKLAPPERLKDSYDVYPATCRQCGQALAGHDPEPYRHQVTEIPPVIAEVVEYRLHALACPGCGTTTNAALPPGVPQGAFGPHLQALLALLTGRYRLSKRDAEEVLDDFFQVAICTGAICALEQRTSAALSAPVHEARAYVKEQAAVHLDETGWREANQKAWLWVAATSLVTVFLIRCRRGGQIAKELLGETFGGILHSDRWSAYNWLPVFMRQLCWAHLRRDFQAFAERGGEAQRIGEAILTQSAVLFEWWHQVRAGTMTRAVFQANMRPVEQKVGELLRQGTACTHDKTAGTCRDILKREPALWTFVRVAGVEPTNNLGERQVRHAVLWRKMCFGTQSEAGSRFAERIMTVVATLKQQERNVLEYLTEACEAANWGRAAPSLLPTASPP